MSMTLTYTTEKDGVLYPDLTLILPEPEELPLSKYGMMHKKFLKEHREATYNRLLLSGKLEQHLADIDRQAKEMMETITAQMAESQGVIEEMKAKNPMQWVGLMNNIRNAAEEIVLHDLILA